MLSQNNEDIPVFMVKKENGKGRTRTIHRNRLLPDFFVAHQNLHLLKNRNQDHRKDLPRGQKNWEQPNLTQKEIQMKFQNDKYPTES